MKRFGDSVINQSGKPVSGASVTVYLTGTSTLASLYSDDGVTACSNPVTTDSLGAFYFFLADGRYDILISGGSPAITNRTLTDVEIADVLSATAGLDNSWRIQDGTTSSRQGNCIPTDPIFQVRRYSGNSPLVGDSEQIGDSGAQPALRVINNFSGATGKPWGGYFLADATGLTTGTVVGLFGGALTDSTSNKTAWCINSVALVRNTTGGGYGIEADVQNESGVDAALHSGPLYLAVLAAGLAGTGGKKNSAAFYSTADGTVPFLEGIHLEAIDTAGTGLHVGSSVTHGAFSGPLNAIWVDPITAATGAGVVYASGYFRQDVSNWSGGAALTNSVWQNATPPADTTWKWRLLFGAASGGPGVATERFSVLNDGTVTVAGASGSLTITSAGNIKPVGIVLTGATPSSSAGELAIGTTTSATATNGTGEAMKANVEGYLNLNLGGTVVKVPYVKG